MIALALSEQITARHCCLIGVTKYSFQTGHLAHRLPIFLLQSDEDIILRPLKVLCSKFLHLC